MSDEPIILDEKAREAVHAARNAAQAVELARVAQFQELTESLKEKTTATLTLAENKAKSLVESAAKDASNLIEIARLNAVKMLGDKSTGSEVEIRSMAKDISYIQQSIAKIEMKLDRDYVTVDQFTPVRNIVYGMVGVFGLATMGAILKLVIIP